MALIARILPAGLSALLLITAPALAQGVPDGRLVRGTLSFDARATLGDFTGTTDSVRGALHGAPVLGQVRGWVEAPAASLVTGNDHRDRDLRKSMETDKYPAMRFELDSVMPERRLTDSMEAVLVGGLTLHGVTHPVRIPGVLTFTADSVAYRGGIRINVKDYGVGGLSRLLGMFSMNKEIDVHIDVTFALADAPGS